MARQQAYAPYSRFTVGAALLTSTGRVFSGCNVENASYGLAICAERSAVCNMVTAGERSIVAVAVASKGAVTPCGACRQVLSEFGDDFEVLCVDGVDGRLQKWTIKQLLPGAFKLERDRDE